MIDISILPEFIREWVKSLGSLENIQDVELSRDCDMCVSDGGYRTYIPNGYFKMKVTIPPLEHCCTFAQIHPGEWVCVDEYGNISYTGEYEEIVEKKELSDKDAFDLMDSIRSELWK